MNGRARHVYLPRFDCLIRDHYFLFAVRGLIIVNLELLGHTYSIIFPPCRRWIRMGIQEVVVDKRRTRRAHRASKFKLILFY